MSQQPPGVGRGDEPRAASSSAPSQYGQYGQQPPPPGGPAASGYGQYGDPYGGRYGGAPLPTAAQPGIIPLRPLTLGEIYDGAFRAIRTNPKVMFGLAAVVIGTGALLQTIFATVFFTELERALYSGAADLDAAGGLEAVSGLAPVLGVLFTSVGSGLATLILQGLAIISVSESVIGRSLTIRQVWQRAKGRLWRLIGLSVTLWIAVMLLIVAFTAIGALVVGGLVEYAGDAAVVVFALLPLVLLGVVALLAFLWVRTMLATCVLMLERSGIFASIARSWRLTKGHFWRLLGIMLLTAIIVGVLSAVLTVPFSMIGALAAYQNVVLSVAFSALGQIAGSVLAVPMLAAVLALLYVDVRMRTEGLDVELARAAQGS